MPTAEPEITEREELSAFYVDDQEGDDIRIAWSGGDSPEFNFIWQSKSQVRDLIARLTKALRR